MFLAAWGAGGYWLGQRGAAFERASRSALLIEPKNLDFGRVWAEEAFVWPITLANRSDKPVRVGRFAASCDCTRIEPASLVLAPHSSGTVRLTIDLRRQRADDSWERDFAIRLRAHYALEGMIPKEQVWVVRGRVRDVVRYDPFALRFGEGLVVGSRFQRKSWRLACHPAVRELAARCEPAAADVELAWPKGSSGSIQLALQPRPDLPVGNHSFHVVLSGSDERGSPLPETRLPVSLRVVHDVAIEPPHLTFALVPADQPAARTVQLRSRTGRPFEVVQVRSADGVLQVLPELPANAPAGTTEQRFRVRLEATRSEAGSVPVTFVVQSESRQRAELPLEVSWVNGPAADASRGPSGPGSSRTPARRSHFDTAAGSQQDASAEHQSRVPAEENR